MPLYPPHITRPATETGFTLIEVSIVLVVIGLIVGSIFVGYEMVSTAAVRAQIAQIDKYNSAVNLFQAQYGGLPGDLAITPATGFGFNITGCGGNQPGDRDGNGLINGGSGNNLVQYGENLLFWYDLGAANLIDGTFPGNGASLNPCSGGIALTLAKGTSYIGDFFPAAKIGGGNFVYVYESNGYNWYGISAVTSTLANGQMSSSPVMPVIQAYNIDNKTDDGIPTSGSVLATYETSEAIGNANPHAGDTAASCYNSSTNAYSISQNGGHGPNCALSFQFPN